MRKFSSLLVVLTLTALGALPLLPAFAQPTVDVTIRPAAAEDVAVRNGRDILVSGTTPSGGPITSAELVAVEVDGDEQRYPVAGVNGPAADTYHLRNDDGQLSGRVLLGCGFGPPDPSCPPGHDDLAEMYLVVTVGAASGASNRLDVDYTKPRILAFHVLETGLIEVVFSEPVRLPADDDPRGNIGDNPADWSVRDPDATVLRVRRPAFDRRELDLGPGLGEDATPEAAYFQALVSAQYEDFASNAIVASDATGGRQRALDLIRPAVPRIAQVSGKAPAGGTINHNDPNPRVRVENVIGGHTVEVTAAGPTTKTVATTVADGATAVDVYFPDALADGGYDVSVVVTDPHGNRSDETTKRAARTDSGPAQVRYVLDTVVPIGLAAVQNDLRHVTVTLSEAVAPAGHAGSWTVGDQEATATGEGDTRTLETGADIADGSEVRWEPTATSPLSGPGSYADPAGNQLATVRLPLGEIPPLLPPTLLFPTVETATRNSRIVISGRAPFGPDLVVDLLQRGTQTRVNSAPVSDGQWEIDQELAGDARYRYDVALRDTRSGARSESVAVPDIVRDTTLPQVDVTSPAQTPLNPTTPTDRRERRGPGGTVTVRWTSSDEGVGDTVDPDHAQLATISIVYGDGNSRVVGTRPQTDADAGREQTFDYTLTEADLAGLGERQAHFRVTVTDVAGNDGWDDSAPILIVGSLVEWTPFVVAPGQIEVRFPIVVAGQTFPLEWLTDESNDGSGEDNTGDAPVQQVEKIEREGRTIIRLTVLQMRDPNIRPDVTYRPLPVNTAPLEGPNERTVVTGTKQAVDAIAPVLALTETPPSGLRDTDVVTFRGQTDVTDFPNDVAVYQIGAQGHPEGPAVATVEPATDGTFLVNVPVRQNAVNRFAVQAVDPSGNLSAMLPEPPVTVDEDSLAPVVRFTNPLTATTIRDPLVITWETVDAHRDDVRIEYRGPEGYQLIVDREDDDGSFTWDVPAELTGAVFGLRITATDQLGKVGSATVEGLRVDLVPPTVASVRATGAQVVEVRFDEPVVTGAVPGGFTVEGVNVRTIKGDGATRTLIVDRALPSTRPSVTFAGDQIHDLNGNPLAATTLVARRSFAFAVTKLAATKPGRDRVRLTWADARNERRDLQGYRVYRDGRLLATTPADHFTYTDRVKGRHTYTVRALDDRGRVSSRRTIRTP